MRRSFALAGWILLLVSALGSLPDPAWAFDPSQEALLVLHVSTPDQVSTPTRLHVSHVEWIGRSAKLRLTPEFPVLDAAELANRSPLWLQAEVPPGVVDTLEIVWSDAEVRVGRAWTRPAIEGHVTRIVLQHGLAAGDVLFGLLRWDPDATAPDAARWKPSITFSVPAMPPLGARLYVSQEGSGTVGIVDRRDARTVGAIGVGGRPRGLAWSATQRRLFVAVAGRDEVVAIDAAARNVLQRVPLALGDDPSRLHLSQDTTRLAVLVPGRDAVVLLSTNSLQEIARINVSRDPVALAEDPRTGQLYVSCQLGRRIEVIDPLRGEVVRSIETADPPGELAVLRAGGPLVVAAGDLRRVQLIDPGTGADLGRIELCGIATGLIVHPRSTRVYATLRGCLQISVLHPERFIESAQIDLPATPGLPFLDPENRWILVPLPTTNRVLWLDASRPTNQRVVDVGKAPWAVVAP